MAKGRRKALTQTFRAGKTVKVVKGEPTEVDALPESVVISTSPEDMRLALAMLAEVEQGHIRRTPQKPKELAKAKRQVETLKHEMIARIELGNWPSIKEYEDILLRLYTPAENIVSKHYGMTRRCVRCGRMFLVVDAKSAKALYCDPEVCGKAAGSSRKRKRDRDQLQKAGKLARRSTVRGDGAVAIAQTQSPEDALIEMIDRKKNRH